MTSELPPCPKCKSTLTYEDGPLLICPECAHEWSASAPAQASETEHALIVKDAHGTQLHDGDSVTIIKDLSWWERSAPRAPTSPTRIYEGGRHERLNETNRAEVTADLLAWLEAKVPRARQ